MAENKRYWVIWQPSPFKKITQVTSLTGTPSFSVVLWRHPPARKCFDRPSELLTVPKHLHLQLSKHGCFIALLWCKRKPTKSLPQLNADSKITMTVLIARQPGSDLTNGMCWQIKVSYRNHWRAGVWLFLEHITEGAGSKLQPLSHSGKHDHQLKWNTWHKADQSSVALQSETEAYTTRSNAVHQTRQPKLSFGMCSKTDQVMDTGDAQKLRAPDTWKKIQEVEPNTINEIMNYASKNTNLTMKTWFIRV